MRESAANLNNNLRQKLKISEDSRKGKCVVATQDISPGSTIGYCEGDETPEDTVHSIHLGGSRIDPVEPFRYISHSCSPNAEFKDKGRILYAVRSIRAGEEITIDYLYTEPVISAPFACKCGSADCRGFICTPTHSG